MSTSVGRNESLPVACNFSSSRVLERFLISRIDSFTLLASRWACNVTLLDSATADSSCRDFVSSRVTSTDCVLIMLKASRSLTDSLCLSCTISFSFSRSNLLYLVTSSSFFARKSLHCFSSCENFCWSTALVDGASSSAVCPAAGRCPETSFSNACNLCWSFSRSV